jgi:hypothetical protein
MPVAVSGWQPTLAHASSIVLSKQIADEEERYTFVIVDENGEVHAPVF